MAVLLQVIGRRSQWIGRAVLACACLGCLSALPLPAAPEEVQPAEFDISGYGIFGNRQLKRMLRTLELGKTRPQYFGATFVEDAALLLTARVKRDGYLEPKITARLRLADGQQIRVTAAELLDNPLPRPLRVTRAEFRIHEGRLYFFEALAFEGLESIPEKQARSYFMETDTLLQLKRSRVFTDERLKRGLASLTDVLERRGYQEIKAEVAELQRDDQRGAVRVRIRVREGPRYLVKSVREEFYYEDATKPAETNQIFPNKPYSQLWLQDLTLSLRTNLYRRGFPDATATTRILERKPAGEHLELDLLATVSSGPQIRVGEVEFEGEKHTLEEFMAQRVPLESGGLLDRVAAEEGRTRLAELGIFDNVALRYEPVSNDTRNLIYDVEEGERWNFSLLFGWGSYEMARGGLIMDALNIWGRAHHARIKVVQSIKSSRGEFTYNVPAFLGRDLDLFFLGSGLRREEVDFTRVEYGGGLGVHKFLKAANTDLTVRYDYQILNALNAVPAVASEGLVSPAVGAIITDAKFDRRDNPLYPRRGYKLFATLESATQYLGGDANYQRIELSPSWHQRLGSGRFLGVGLSHGVAMSFGDPARNLPFNRRFFPGGDHSIRGYQEGEASPRNEDGDIVGAETYLLATVELEQALTPKWSLVGFVDSLGFARRLEDYPFDTGLFSVGGGVRWKTILGPVRLEYGHNLNPRAKDPDWTIHFSLGFPF